MADNDYIDNPAGRLLRFLRKARQINWGNGTQVGAQLIHLFPTAKNAGDLLTFLKQVDIYLALIDEVKRQLEICDESHLYLFLRAEPHLKGFANIMPLQQQWSDFREKYMREADLVVLEVASITLHRFFPERMIDPAEIDSLKVKLSDLYDEALKSNLEFGLRRMMLKSLEELVNAVLAYELTGSAHLDDAVGGIIGRAMMHQDFAATAVAPDTESRKNEEVQSLAIKFWAVLDDMCTNLGARESLQTIREALRHAKSKTYLPLPTTEQITLTE